MAENSALTKLCKRVYTALPDLQKDPSLTEEEKAFVEKLSVWAGKPVKVAVKKAEVKT
ncbi:MAG: hypothetical protein KGH64_04645 [Candidatus Micrarchaeota archaeon]|nr:hypothetical protein [Candidatus Micrarchaeota archaeon]MDE1834601.1 hypothetical protein [Candidatus Micrarchaeota archaeon]